MSRRPFVRRMPVFWWLRHRRYRAYMARELTSLFIAAYTAVLLIGVVRLAEGPVAYGAFLEALRSPPAIAFHLLALAGALLHTTTWFGLAPKALPPRVGGAAVPARAVVAAHYAGWIVISAAILLLAGA